MCLQHFHHGGGIRRRRRRRSRLQNHNRKVKQKRKKKKIFLKKLKFCFFLVMLRIVLLTNWLRCTREFTAAEVEVLQTLSRCVVAFVSLLLCFSPKERRTLLRNIWRETLCYGNLCLGKEEEEKCCFRNAFGELFVCCLFAERFFCRVFFCCVCFWFFRERICFWRRNLCL